MSTGTGIFLAGLFIGLVMLYGQTKDRWDWTRIFIYLVLLVILAFILFFCFIYFNSAIIEPYVVIRKLLPIMLGLAIAAMPFNLMQLYYTGILKLDFEYDDDKNERSIHKFALASFVVLSIFITVFFYGELDSVVTYFSNAIHHLYFSHRSP